VMADAAVTGWKIRSSVLGHGVQLQGSAPQDFVSLMLGEQSAIQAG
jgi:hypothetical protein